MREILETDELTISSLLKEIDELKAELDSKRPLSEAALQNLLEHSTVEHIYNSNAIEGNTLDHLETALAVEGFTVNNKPVKDYLETYNLHIAFKEMLKLASNQKPITERMIKYIHTIVLNDNLLHRGKFRTDNVRIAGSSLVPPIPEQVPSLVRNLLYEYELFNLHPIEKIARFHAEFESIHPFIDGNGRTGRLLMSLQLIRHGYNNFNIKYAERPTYYKCLEAYHANDDANPITHLCCKYAIEKLKEYLTMINNRDRAERLQAISNKSDGRSL